MRVQAHHATRRGRASKRDRHRAAHSRKTAPPIEVAAPYAFEMFSDRLEDRAEYERIIRDFVSVHDAVFAADEYDT